MWHVPFFCLLLFLGGGESFVVVERGMSSNIRRRSIQQRTEEPPPLITADNDRTPQPRLEVVKDVPGEPPSSSEPVVVDEILGLVIVVYFLQGALSLARLATNFYLKDDLGLSAAELAAITGLFSIPWVVKPLYGLASDAVPIAGSRRKSYLALSGLVGCASFCALAASPTKQVVVAANLVASASVAVSDVVADSVVVEQSKTEKRASELQSAAWASRYVGAIGASLASGPALAALGARGAWLATAPLPLLVAAASLLVKEDVKIETPPIGDALKSLRQSLTNPEILRPVLFIFLWQATPSCGSAFFMFSTAPEPVGLGFDPDFTGKASAAASAAGLAGVGAYNLFFKEAKLSKVIQWTTILSAVIGATPLLLVYHINRDYLGIDDKFFTIGDDVVQSALGEVGFLPILVLAAKITPPGIEGVFFAALMSIFNLGGIVSQELGAIVTSALGVDQSTNFNNLPLLILICSASSTLPLLGLDWVRRAEMSTTESSSSTSGDVVAEKESSR